MSLCKTRYPLWLLLSLSVSTAIFAQEEVKVDKKTKEALKMRYESDKMHAELARSSFNVSSWVGGKLPDLIASWGPPTRTVSDEAGGQIVVYETFRSGTSGSYTPGYTVTNGFGQVVEQKRSVDTRSSYSFTQYSDVYVDKNNVVTKINRGNR